MGAEFTPLDWARIFFGDGELAAPLFLLEIVIRASVLFLFTAWFARTIGGSIGDLGPFDIVLIVVIGSAAGDPMFYPDVPLIHGMLVISVVLVFARAKQALMARHPVAQEVIIGRPIALVIGGQVEEHHLGSKTLTHGELLSMLRAQGVRDIAHVELAVFEPTGELSVFTYPLQEGRCSAQPAPSSTIDEWLHPTLG